MATQYNVVIIGGPTASGKSGLGLSIAQVKNGVVINADSMQVYDGLHLLTAQPSAEDLASVPHKLYSCLAPDDLCTAVRWRQFALQEINAAHEAGQLPVIVGGTGFYLNALLHGLSPIPEIPANVRNRLIVLQAEIGTAGLFEMLQAADPMTAEKLDGANTQRVIRALEVFEHTGQPLKYWQDKPRIGPPDHLKFLTATLIPPRDTLYDRCDIRFDAMLDMGAEEEVRQFKKRHVPTSPLTKALGYPQLSAMLDGEMSLLDARAASQKSTRNYAKRQTTWFNNQIEAHLRLTSADEAVKILEQL